MKIVYSSRYQGKYTTNPVESPDRIRLPSLELSGYKFIEPEPAGLKDISRVHGLEHIERIKKQGLFEAASLSAGGAIAAAEMAWLGDPAFALIRPPGHHASANRAWGMCFFNNMAIAVKRILPRAGRVLIIDIDLHFGDGTVSIFRGNDSVKIVNPGSIDVNFDYLNLDGGGYLKQIEQALESNDYSIIGVSAGFDTYIEDWGGLLTDEDYFKIGSIIKEASERRCCGRRFAILEGGYSPKLRYNIKSFIGGFS